MKRPGTRLTAGGIGKEISDLGKELEREHDEAGTDGAAFALSKA